jgi:hypothetical protein
MLAEAPPTEEILDEALGLIQAFAMDDLRPEADRMSTADDAWDLIASVDAWASLASYATQRIYLDEAPAVGTPFPSYPGWQKKVPRRLRDLARALGAILEQACRLLRALSYSLSVNFPFGVSVSVSWQP